MAGLEQVGQDIEAALIRSGPTPWGDNTNRLDDYPVSLQAVIACIINGSSPLQFMAGIDAGNRQMGNRAFLHWVGELYAAGRESEAHEVAVQGSQAPGQPQTRRAPLQLIPKKMSIPVAGGGESIGEYR